MAENLDFEGVAIDAKDTMEQVRFILDAVLEDGAFQDAEFPPRLFYLIRASHTLLVEKLLDQEAMMAAIVGAQ